MWSNIVIFWTVFGCFFAPIYFTALLCSIVKICRDRKRIKGKNEKIRQQRECGDGIEAQGSAKRPNIEIIHDEERAKRFRSSVRKQGTPSASPEIDRPFIISKSETTEYQNKNKSNKGINSNGGLANGHSTNVTIEHCLSEKENTLEQSLVQDQGILISDSYSGKDNTADVTAIEGDDSLDVITSPSESGSFQANTDTEIICDADGPTEDHFKLNHEKTRHALSSEDGHLHPHPKPPRKTNKKHHNDRDRSRTDENTEPKSDPTFVKGESLDEHKMRNRRTSFGIIQSEEEKQRKDQGYRMSLLRSKSEDNIGKEDAVDSTLLIHEQGKENLAFERSTENTRM